MEERKFRKSSFSAHGIWGANCVEVSREEDIAVRDSKDPSGGALSFTRDEWDAFVKGVKAGEFDV